MSREKQTIKVRKLLHELRILPNKKGYEYIVEAVSIALDSLGKTGGRKNLIGIYDEIAEKFESTYFRVERCIRYAIRDASENPSEKMLTLFPYLPVIPTNSTFISVLAEHLAFQSEGIANNATTTGEWISVDERLPEQFETVLVFCDTGARKFQCVSEMIEPNGKRWSAVCGFRVTHWMPLPEAPKMKGGAE